MIVNWPLAGVYERKLREHFYMFSKSLLRCFAGDVALRAFAPLKDLLPAIVVFYLKQPRNWPGPRDG